MLKHEITTPENLDQTSVKAMFSLMQQHYSNLDRERFLNDLKEKNSIVLIKNPDESIAGFSTVLTYEEKELNAKIIYSGDTIIHKEHWGSPVLFYGFGSLLKKTIEGLDQGQKAYWFLLSKGYRTYLMLPLFFKEYWPAKEVSTNTLQLKDTLDVIAKKKFGPLYDPESSIVETKADYLNAELSGVPANRRNHAMINFFLEKNPGYTRGTELACITEIALDNIQAPARRFVK